MDLENPDTAGGLTNGLRGLASVSCETNQQWLCDYLVRVRSGQRSLTKAISCSPLCARSIPPMVVVFHRPYLWTLC